MKFSTEGKAKDGEIKAPEKEEKSERRKRPVRLPNSFV